MNASIEGVRVLVIISVLVGIIAHYNIKQYSKALILSGLISSVLFQVAAWIYIGYLDPFFIIALVTGMIIASLISAVVGLPFLIRRKGDQE